ncbi:glycosyltransferase [Lutibaculum baratangense]|uniref:Putative glycosyl transferase, WecB/TagA/CpsF family protein n=1 Tax=Lutibaculum baratangense AMV1 TaxID=631454 RepID=V4RA48_9HYPH|nr:glycosyltransferase family 2 protein [Lutibaculum baratangense]ESR23041.1 putative glycosyl transferase, WecB/TagA/CpsF family protein [Lutibaculum baratangense AMV1]
MIHPQILGVAIVTYNSADVLPTLLDSLRDALEPVPHAKVIVVDNQSADGSPALAERHVLAPNVLRMGRNAGYSAAINAAARVLPPEADLLVLNPDVTIEAGAVLRMMRVLRASGVGAVVPALIGDSGELSCSLRREPSLVTALGDALLGGTLAGSFGWGEMITAAEAYQASRSVDWATGAALLISAEARRRAGEWDEGYFLYSEETDYMRRIRESGLQIRFVPEATVRHRGGDSNVNPDLYALMVSNRVRYFRRWHGSAAAAALRAVLILQETIRAGTGRTHRRALRTLLGLRSPCAAFLLRPETATVHVLRTDGRNGS